jgi:hypothetical protein
MDGKFLCNDCKDLEPADEDLVREGEPAEEE